MCLNARILRSIFACQFSISGLACLSSFYTFYLLIYLFPELWSMLIVVNGTEIARFGDDFL